MASSSSTPSCHLGDSFCLEDEARGDVAEGVSDGVAGVASLLAVADLALDVEVLAVWSA